MNQVTWRWKEEDLVLWYQWCPEDETYKKQCRQWQNSWTVVGAGIAFLLVRLMTKSGWALLGVVLGAALVYGILGWSLRRDNPSAREQWLREAREEFDPAEHYTLTLEPEGLRLSMEGSEHWYQWNNLEAVSVLPSGFLAILIKGMDDHFHIPPSAFADPVQRDTFVELLTSHARTTPRANGSWWRGHSEA
jgi:hypothetical protein